MRYRVLFIVCSFALFCGGTVHATALSGTFNMSGIFAITTTSVSFSSSVSPFASGEFTLSGGTGSFVGLDGTNDVNSISGAVNPVGTAFAPTVFISFPSTTDPTLDLDFIAAGGDPSTACSAAPASGQICTPAAVSGQILNMLNLQNNASGGSSASWVVLGVTSDGLSSWSADFTAQFTVPYQTVLADIASTGQVSDSYSASVTVTQNVSPTPEPGTLILFGSGLLGLVGVLRRKACL
jgi:hypothetical protein